MVDLMANPGFEIIGAAGLAILAFLLNSLLQRKFSLVERIWEEKYQLLSKINEQLLDLDMIAFSAIGMAETMREEDPKKRYAGLISGTKILVELCGFNGLAIDYSINKTINSNQEFESASVSHFNDVIKIMDQRTNKYFHDIYQLANRVNLILFDKSMKEDVIKIAGNLTRVVTHSKRYNENYVENQMAYQEAHQNLMYFSVRTNKELRRTRMGASEPIKIRK